MTAPSGDELVTVRMLAEAMQTVQTTDTRLVLTEDEQRQATEDFRSQRRNRNRVLMIVVAWVATLTVPIIAYILKVPMLAQYAASIGFTGDLLVTGYSWIKNY